MKISSKSAKLLLGSVLLTSAVMASAAVELVQNGSFENGAFVPDFNGVHTLLPGATAMTSWTVINSKVAWIDQVIGAAIGLTADTGIKYLDLTDYANAFPLFGGVAQNVAVTPNTTYKLTFAVGSSSTYNVAPAILLSVAGLNINFATAPTTSTNSWTHFAYTFTTPLVGTTLPVSFTGIQGLSYIGLDSVSITVVPEPSSVAMLFAGLAAVGTVVARRRNQMS